MTGPISLRRSLFIQVLALLAILGSFVAQAAVAANEDLKQGCFERHLKEAIEINERRLPLYSKLSNGESEKTSNALLKFERVTLYIAKYFDWITKDYQAQGIPILCAEFVPMHTTAKFFQSPDRGPRFPRPIPPFPKAIDTAKIQTDIKIAYERRGFEGISDYLKPVVRELEKEGPYHCMTRHALESILRTALLAPVHMERAQALGLPSTETISWKFIRGQAFILARNNKIDTGAFPIQAAWGIPTICGDVPKIISPEQLEPNFRFTEEPDEVTASPLPNP